MTLEIFLYVMVGIGAGVLLAGICGNYDGAK